MLSTRRCKAFAYLFRALAFQIACFASSAFGKPNITSDFEALWHLFVVMFSVYVDLAWQFRLVQHLQLPRNVRTGPAGLYIGCWRILITKLCFLNSPSLRESWYSDLGWNLAFRMTPGLPYTTNKNSEGLEYESWSSIKLTKFRSYGQNRSEVIKHPFPKHVDAPYKNVYLVTQSPIAYDQTFSPRCIEVWLNESRAEPMSLLLLHK